MPKDYINRLRRKATLNGNTFADQAITQMRDEFNKMVDNLENPSVHRLPYVPMHNVGYDEIGKLVNVVITDITLNDIKVNDDKMIQTKFEDTYHVGDQVYFAGHWWIFYHEEYNSIQSHKTFSMKRCNITIPFVIEGTKYSIPTSIISLTLYSDGLADKVYISNSDGKRRIYLPDNEITKKMSIGTRVMLTGNTVFEITHVDDFSRPGCRDCIMAQIYIVSRDDKENNTAYNKISEPMQRGGIIGTENIYLGSSCIYTCYDAYERLGIGCVTLVARDNCVWIDKSYDGIKLTCTDDIDYIGEKVMLIISDGDAIYKKEITIKGFF